MTTGVVVMAYGTPASADEVEAYYTHVRRGRPPTAEQLADLVRRYDAIGGTSPLLERTRAQVDAIAAALERRSPGTYRVALGMKHAAPFVEDAVASLAAGGVDDVVALVLAPHYSRLSVGEYHERVAKAAADHGLPTPRTVDSWHLEPAYLDLLAERVDAARRTVPDGSKIVFTAHSLPARILDEGDPYPDQLHQTAAAVAERTGLAEWSGWAVAWQSAAVTPEPWLGPDIRDVIRDLAGTGRSPGSVVCPIGFVSDHLEILYDLDVDAAGVAAEEGLAFARTDSLNDDPRLMEALAGVVEHVGAGR